MKKLCATLFLVSLLAGCDRGRAYYHTHFGSHPVLHQNTVLHRTTVIHDVTHVVPVNRTVLSTSSSSRSSGRSSSRRR
ncbi:MAG: hypothetical protein JWM80_2105 [Cyanobacteria bacterium RYN_339]|nr:hypothetical protein [Cyanobacteria bacterium RYN_339]